MSTQKQYILASHGLIPLKINRYKPGITYPQKGEDEYKVEPYPDVAERMDPGQPEVLSWMGTPVFDRLTLKEPNSGLSIDIDTVLLEVRNKRNIVITSVQGLSDSVKELITNSDFTVTIRGAIVNGGNPRQFPFQDMSTLIRLCSAENELDCTSDFLSLFNIYHLVVVDPRFVQNRGAQNYQTFEIKCLSDNPVELKIDEQG